MLLAGRCRLLWPLYRMCCLALWRSSERPPGKWNQHPRRFRSLPEKFNAIAGLAKGDILVVWEDDDIYLPHHISTHVRAMEGRLWSKPSFVLSSYTGRPTQKDATSRLHASLAFRREIFDRIGGWPLTKRGDFDKGRTPSPRKHRRTCAGMPIC